MTVVRPSAPIVVRPSMPFQRLPPGVPPSSSAPIRPRMATPSASAILSHAHMRKQAAPQPPPSESKYEDYSDVSLNENFSFTFLSLYLHAKYVNFLLLLANKDI